MRYQTTPPEAGADPLQGLMRFEDYAQSRRHVFPSPESFRWFFRLHRARLVEAGAVYRIAGRNLVNAPAVDQVAAEVGREEARRGAPMELAEVLP
jgi:hypothetical protein